MSGRGGERAERLALDDEALLVQRPEEILRDAVVVPRRRPREEVVREPERAEVLADERVEAVGRLTRRLARRVGRDHDRRAVLVGPADHEDVVPAQSVIAGEGVRRDAEARHMADVPEAARIRPRDCDQDLPRLRPIRSRAPMIGSRLLATWAHTRRAAEEGDGEQRDRARVGSERPRHRLVGCVVDGAHVWIGDAL